MQTIKTAILKSQSRAVKSTNKELLSLYYSIGGYVSINSRNGAWGTNAINSFIDSKSAAMAADLKIYNVYLFNQKNNVLQI